MNQPAERPTLAPIETYYNGFLFRSRTEARWATFFNHLGIAYSYEPDGFDLEGIWYLPDFYLPGLDCYFEIKGLEPTPDEIAKARRLSLHSGKRTFVAVGAPWTDTAISAYMYGIRQDIMPKGWQWFICPTCGNPGIADPLLFIADHDLQSGFHSPGCKCVPHQLYYKNERIINAFTTARQARFEQRLQVA